MKYSLTLLAVLSLPLFTGCSQETAQKTSLINENVIAGVAATGAPISNGKVEIKGSDGQVVIQTTAADGSYSADIGLLEEPYLVRVIAPSGEKYISVASKSALAQGKKVNVTPLSHMIVANVFEKADPDEIFSNFETESNNYTDTKLEAQKVALVQKFKDAGLIGSDKIVDESVDLLNGELRAGTSLGLDGLLDVIDVNTSSANGMVVKLKGENTAIITDKVDEADPPAVAINATQLAASKAKLTVIEKIREMLNAFATLHTSYMSCNGAPVDDGSACDIDTLSTNFLAYFHSDFNENGLTEEQAVWDWICVKPDDGVITSRATCLSEGQVSFEDVVLKDVTLINYDDVTKIALVSLNAYINGMLEHAEEMYIKLDSNDNKFKMAGNKKTFFYWIETESVHQTQHENSTGLSVDNYSVNLNFWYDNPANHTFAGNEVFTLEAVSGHAIFPGPSSTMTLYLVKGPQYDELGQCSTDLLLSTRPDPYKTFNNDGTSSYASFANACTNNNACNCSNGASYYFDYDTAQKVTLSSTLIAAMDKVERIRMTLAGNGAFSDEFVIRKPLVVNEFNAASIVPTFGSTVSSFCANSAAPRTLSVESGSLSHISLYIGHENTSTMTWGNQSDSSTLREAGASVSYTPPFSLTNDDVIRYTHLYLSSRDENDRQFVRQVSCN